MIKIKNSYTIIGRAPHVVSRNSFPHDFLFGVGTSALQVKILYSLIHYIISQS